MIALYPVRVAGSGLWLRVPLVVFTTAMAVAGYVVPTVDAVYRDSAPLYPPHWHLVVPVMVVLTGFIVSCLVHRVRVLRPMLDRRFADQA